MKLVDPYKNQGYHHYFDNYYKSNQLVTDLFDANAPSCGTTAIFKIDPLFELERFKYDYRLSYKNLLFQTKAFYFSIFICMNSLELQGIDGLQRALKHVS